MTKTSMSKTSGSSKEKSIREEIKILTNGVPKAPPGWKTKREWIKMSGIALRTFENKLAVLMDLGHAKKKQFRDHNGNTRYHFWINNLSDENQD